MLVLLYADRGIDLFFPQSGQVVHLPQLKREASADLAIYLLETAHVATVGGHAFGAPDCIRLSYAASDEAITEAMRRIAKALSELK